MASLESYLKEAGFVDVEVKLKEESREVISQWLPGSGAEEFVIGAEVTAKKK
jgi:arsenite methyltransferase